MSLYPTRNEVREGDPIADAWEVHATEGQEVVFALADGMGWGQSKKEAAQKAVQGFVGAALGENKDTRELGGVLQKALQAAHGEIVRGKNDVWECGTCTLAVISLLFLMLLIFDDGIEGRDFGVFGRRRTVGIGCYHHWQCSCLYCVTRWQTGI